MAEPRPPRDRSPKILPPKDWVGWVDRLTDPLRPARNRTLHPRGALSRRATRTLDGVTNGTVISLHRWPVKSFRGEEHEALDIDLRGVPGDRAHAVWLKGGKRATARLVPGLLRWAARYEADVNGSIPRPTVTAPDGATYAWDDPALPAALAADRTVTWTSSPTPPACRTCRTRSSSRSRPRAASSSGAGRTDRSAPVPHEHHVDADAGPWAEAAWEGRTLRIGDAELELLHPCLRCSIVARDPETNAKSPAVLKRLVREHGAIFGINARPRNTTTIHLGDPVTLA